MDIDAFGKDAMATLLAGDTAGFDSKLRQFDPKLVTQLYDRACDIGRQAFKEGRHPDAIEAFTGALAFAPDPIARSRLFCNRAACCLKMNRYLDAFEEAKKAIALDSSWDKAWYRAACALHSLKRYEEALSCLSQSLKCRGSEPEHVTTDAASIELQNHYARLSQEYNQVRMKSRYEIDYSRFQRIADQIVSEEAEAEAREAQQGEPTIEFAKDLSEDQKAALTAQLTGSYSDSYTEERLKELSAPRPSLNLALDDESVPLKHRQAMGRILQVQHEAQYATRLLALWDTGVSRIWAHHLLSVAQDSRTFGFVGYEAVYPLVYTWKNMKDPKPEIHVIARSLSGVAMEAVKRFLEKEKSSDLLKLRFYLRNEPSSEESTANAPTSSSVINKGCEEELLKDQGAAVIAALKPQLPSEFDLVVIDPEGIDNYLLGPRNPVYELRKRNWRISRLFPQRIVVNMQLCHIDVPKLWDTPAMHSALRWSLLPQRLPLDMLSRVERLSESLVVWTLDSELQLPPDELRLSFAGLRTTPNAILFEVGAYTENGVLIQSDYLKSKGVLSGTLQPSFWWLTPSAAEPPPLHTCGQWEAIINTKGHLLASISLSDGDKVHLKTNPIAINCSDRFHWHMPLIANEALNAWESACCRNRQRVEDNWRRITRGKNFGWKSDNDRAQEAPAPKFLLLDGGSADATLRAVQGTIRNRPALRGVAEAVTETNMLVTDGSAGSIRAIKGALMNQETLRALHERCWEKTPDLLKPTGWIRADGKAVDIAHESDDRTATAMKDWLFSRTTNEAARLDIQNATIRTLRVDRFDADVRMALCQLYGVPPDTPGLDSQAGCVVIDRTFSSIMLGDVLTYPSDVLSHGLIPTVLYARRVLMQKHGHFLPGRVKLMTQLVRFETSVDDLDVRWFQSFRNPRRPEHGGPPPVPDCKRFHFGYRTETRWTELQQNGLATLIGEPIELFDLNLNESDESRIVRTVCGDRVFTVECQEVADAALVWSEWIFDELCSIGNGPVPNANVITLPTPQQLQLLPRRTAGNLKYCGIPSMTDFILTWEVESEEVDDCRFECPAESTSVVLGMINEQQDELAMTIGQLLSSSVKGAKDVAAGVLGLSRSPGIVSELGLDPEIMNNVLYAALS